MVRPAMNANGETDESGESGGPVYGYRPNMMGAAMVFSLKRNGFAWEVGRRSGFVRYDQVRRVRLSYRPATMQMHRFLTEIWSEQTPKLQIASASGGLLDQTRQDTSYADFIAELHRRLVAAGSTARFEAGMHPLLYWGGSIFMVGLAVMLAILLGRAAINRDLPGFALMAVVSLLFVWQVGSLFYRNRPQTYRPEALPPRVLPR